MNDIGFIANSLKNLKTVGTIFPCSPASARKMTEPIDFRTATVLVELGGGTGAITKEILRNMRPDARLIVFEMNPEFAESLRRLNDTRMTVVQDSAEHLEKYMREHGLKDADAVISTLPFVIIEERLRNDIMEAVMRILRPGGHFIQIQYSLITKKEMKSKFKNLRIDFTPFNLPPSFFYIVTKERDAA